MLRTSTGSVGRSRRRSFSRSIPLAPGSVQVEHQHVPLGAADLRHPFLGVRRLADQRRMKRARQHLLDALPDDGMIVDEKNACHVRSLGSPVP